jgi:hypothetical protein
MLKWININIYFLGWNFTYFCGKLGHSLFNRCCDYFFLLKFCQIRNCFLYKNIDIGLRRSAIQMQMLCHQVHSQAGWPDAFVKKVPKCSPTHLCPNSHIAFYWKVVPQKCGLVLNLKKNCTMYVYNRHIGQSGHPVRMIGARIFWRHPRADLMKMSLSQTRHFDCLVPKGIEVSFYFRLFCHFLQCVFFGIVWSENLVAKTTAEMQFRRQTQRSAPTAWNFIQEPILRLVNLQPHRQSCSRLERFLLYRHRFFLFSKRARLPVAL